MPISAADRLLTELGITSPDEIDLEAIAFYTGARVRLCKLDGCEARIVGNRHNAIISVNKGSPYRRRRFSIAHELGHWHHHRGKCLACRVDEIDPRSPNGSERVADNFAADLLMPRNLFDPIAKQHAIASFKAVDSLADEFQTSQTATAIRLVESGLWPVILVCNNSSRRRWFTSSPSVPAKWFPRDLLDARSFAFDFLFKQKSAVRSATLRTPANGWFDHWEAGKFDIQEESLRVSQGEILTLLTITDRRMLVS